MIVNANALHIPLADGSVHCAISSPPYWGLRDYGTATWQGGDAGCDHSPARKNGKASSTLTGGQSGNSHEQEPYIGQCGKCGAVRIDAQIGLEATPEEYVSHIVAVMREVWRVLRDDGTCWINLGDSYFGGGGYYPDAPSNRNGSMQSGGNGNGQRNIKGHRGIRHETIKPKDLVGIPWMVAFALRADGWYLRSDIIWSKPNPMPESVTDRPTKSHEYIFLLTKSPRYYYDAAAIRETGAGSPNRDGFRGGNGRPYVHDNVFSNGGEGVSFSSVVNVSDLKDKRFTFFNDFGLQEPPSLVLDLSICYAATILNLAQLQYDFRLPALYSEIGEQCRNGFNSQFVAGLPLMDRATVLAQRFTGKDMPAEDFLRQLHSLGVALIDSDQLKKAWGLPFPDISHIYADTNAPVRIKNASKVSKQKFVHEQQYNTGDTLSSTRNRRTVWTIPTNPYSGAHFATFPPALVTPMVLAGCPKGGIVLDPFCGSGTLGEVCRSTGRRFVGLDLNLTYLRELALPRAEGKQHADAHKDLPMFMELAL